MKRNRIIGCLGIVSLMLVWGCTKDLFDMRTKYTGQYSFEIHKSWAYGTQQQWITGDTTYTEAGNVGKGNQDDAVEISMPSFDLEALLREDGSLDGIGNSGSGEFATTGSISYTLRNITPAGSTTTRITGSKQ